MKLNNEIMRMNEWLSESMRGVRVTCVKVDDALRVFLDDLVEAEAGPGGGEAGVDDATAGANRLIPTLLSVHHHLARSIGLKVDHVQG